jgi:leucyl-tRNA synthetase
MIKKMTDDIQNNAYNTAIAAAMGAVNSLYKLKADGLAKNSTWQEALENLVVCVAPFAPHIADELWQQLGHSESVHIDTWPQWDDSLLVTENVTIVVQINGKLRAELSLPANADEATVLEAVRANEKVTSYITGHDIKKTIYVPGKLVNLVV